MTYSAMSRLAAYNAKAVANFFLELAKSRARGIDPMKLQKLVYYAHGWYAGYTNRPLIDESVEAWPYGPVIPSLYHEFKRYGSQPIEALATEFDGSDFRAVLIPAESDVQRFLQNVWDSYGDYTGVKLSELTHAADGPWWKARQMSQGKRSADIPFELIADHFRPAVQRAQARC